MQQFSSIKISILLAVIFGVAITCARFIAQDTISWRTIVPGLAGMVTSGLIVYLLLRFKYKRK